MMKTKRRMGYLARKRKHFWSRWCKEYWVDLREHHKAGIGSGRVAKVGDVVSLRKENEKRGEWKMAIVEELIVGDDGEARGARVRVLSRRGKASRMNRPVQHLGAAKNVIVSISNVCFRVSIG